MRILRYNGRDEPVARARTGALVAPDVIGDLRAGYARCLAETHGEPLAAEVAALRVPADVARILHHGPAGRTVLARACDWLAGLHAREPAARGLHGEPLFTALDAARLHNPLKPARILVVEVQAGLGAPGQVADWAPAAVMGPVRDLPLPGRLGEMRHVPGVGIVVGARCKAVAEHQAAACIAGYTAAALVEGRAPGDALAFRRCIIGPWLTTPDEAGEVGGAEAVSRIGGVLRQCARVLAPPWSAARLLASLSVHGLEPGDVIVAAPPVGDAARPEMRLLAGDVLETAVEGLGVMRNRVVAED